MPSQLATQINYEPNSRYIHWDFLSHIYVLCVAYFMCYRAITGIAHLSNYAAITLSLSIALCLFTLGVTTLTTTKQRKLLPEVILMILWLLWIWFTTFLFHDDVASLPFLRSPLYKATLCIFLYAFVFKGIRKNICEKSLLGLAVGGGVVGILSLLTGEVFMLSTTDMQRLGTGVVGNSNDFGYILILAIFSSCYFAHFTYSKKRRNVLAIFIFILSVLCVLSGSRKTFMAIILFFCLIILLCHFRQVLNNIKHFFYVIILLIITGSCSYWVYNNTHLGNRLQTLVETDLTSGAIDPELRFAGRIRYYYEGWELMKKHPIVGIGLDQFRYYDRGKLPSHSEYISIICETGIPGALLYFGAYYIIISRLLKQRRRGNRRQSLKAGLLLSGILTILFLDFGRWNWDHPPTWIFLLAAASLGLEFTHKNYRQSIRSSIYLRRKKA